MGQRIGGRKLKLVIETLAEGLSIGTDEGLIDDGRFDGPMNRLCTAWLAKFETRPSQRKK